MDYIVGKAAGDEPEVEQPVDGGGILPSCPFRWILSGPSKSGKTNLARWVLDKYFKRANGNCYWDRIILLSPTANIDYTWSKLPCLAPKDRITVPTARHLEAILKEQIKSIVGGSGSESALKNISPATLLRKKRSAKKLLLIFDDAISESSMINSSEFLKTFIQGRHYGISSIIMSQSLMKIPRSVRLQGTALSLFPSKKSEIDRVYSEFGPRLMSRSEFHELAEFATTPTEDDAYPFLHIDAGAPERSRFRRNFTNILQINDSGGTGGAVEQKESIQDPGQSAPPARRGRQPPKKKARLHSPSKFEIP